MSSLQLGSTFERPRNILWDFTLVYFTEAFLLPRQFDLEWFVYARAAQGLFLIITGYISSSQVHSTLNSKLVCMYLRVWANCVGVYNYMSQRRKVLEIPLQTILFSLQCSHSPSAARARGGERERLHQQGWVLKFKTTSPSPGVAVWRLMSYLGRVQLFHMHRVHISDIINFTTLGCCHPSVACHAPMISIL